MKNWKNALSLALVGVTCLVGCSTEGELSSTNATRTRTAQEQRKSNSGAKITNGVAVPLTYFPWVVRIQMPSGGTCTGFFVNPSRMYTAAHCFAPGDTAATVVDGLHGVGVASTRVTIHPSYRAVCTPFDIAIVDFPANTFPLAGGENAWPVIDQTIYPGNYSQYVIMGYGHNDTINRTGAGVRRWGVTTRSGIILDNDGAVIWARGSVRDDGSAPTSGRSANGQGDSGGPLMVYHGNRIAVLGIVSGGRTEGNEEYTCFSATGQMFFPTVASRR
jgi:hypothetical protein